MSDEYNPIHKNKQDGKWYFWDNKNVDRYGPFNTKSETEEKYKVYKACIEPLDMLPKVPRYDPSKDDPANYEVLRHPIFISDNSLIVISTFHSKNGMGYGHLFLMDYVNHRKQTKIAAKDIIKQISELCSMDMLWSLKEAIDEEITEWNNNEIRQKRNHQFPLNRPKDEDKPKV